MSKQIFLIFTLVLYHSLLFAQTKPGIHFQGIARNNNGLIIANKQMNIKIGLYKDSIEQEMIYEEIKSIRTNVLGLFFVNIGEEEIGKINNTEGWNSINWGEFIRFIKVEIDPENDLQFISLGFHPISASPYALYSYSVHAANINGTIALAQGGTGATNLKDLKFLLGIDKINNTPDSLKPITKYTIGLLNEKLNKIDTASLSNRLNQKLNKTDTIYLSNRIQQLTMSIPSPKEWGYFYDTSRQITMANSATALSWNFGAASNTATITTNTAGQATRVTIQTAGIYKVFYRLQFIKSDLGNDEVSIWIRKNSAAYPNTHQIFTIQGGGVKNSFMGNYYLDLGDKDYIEIYYSVKNTNSILMSSPTLTSPSRPATPAAYLIIEKIN
jgi:hypothetical protein